MRLAISGSANQGKTTLINDFLAEWPVYKKESSTYRELLKKEKLPHSKNATKDSQWKILNFMVDELQKYKRTDNVIFDRCPLDNLVYSMWCMEKQTSDIDKEFIDKCIPIVRESMRFLDIIFFTPITKVAPVPIKEDKSKEREIDPVYIKEIDSIFKAIYNQYTLNSGKNPFFPKNDQPGMIEIFGNPLERIQMIKFYVDKDGQPIGGDPSTPDNLFNPENLTAMEALLKEQKKIANNETAYKKEINKIKDFVKKTKR
jgi:predicted ATPase